MASSQGKSRGDAPIRLVMAGKNPCLTGLLDYALQKPRLEIAGLFLDEEDGSALRWALERKLPHWPLSDLADEQAAAGPLARARPDYLINFNATALLGPRLLEIPSHGCLNLHPGPLPRYAGLHVHQWAIRRGESEFGTTLHWMAPAVDAGDVVLSDCFPLTGGETGVSLYMRCLRSGATLVREALDMLAQGRSLPSRPQHTRGRRVYLHREALDGRVDWRRPDGEVLAFFRAADYGPFESPSYKPCARHGGQTLALARAEPGGETGRPAGTVLDAGEGWLEVACGNGRSIRVRPRGKAMEMPRPGDRLE